MKNYKILCLEKMFIGILVVLIAFIIGCGGGGSSSSNNNSSGESFDKKGLLTDIAENLVVPTYESFKSSLGTLDEKIGSYQDSFATNSSGDSSKLTEAQNAWKDVMSIWQKAELMQFGPAGSKSSVLGGKGLRDEIYSWPTVNPCLIDQILVANEFSNIGFLDTQLVNAYGLDALEYLLFYTSFENSCSSQLDINSSGTWVALSNDEISLRRANYASVVMKKVVADTQSLIDAWSATGENFKDKFINAGSNTTVYSSADSAINAVFDALFYIDITTKDEKLALPFGLGKHVNVTKDANNVELKFSKQSLNSISQNVLALEEIFKGTSSSGFDDYLTNKGATTLLSNFNASITSTKTKISEIDSTLFDTVSASDHTKIVEFYTALQELTTLLKTEFATSLKLEIPQSGAGDND